MKFVEQQKKKLNDIDLKMRQVKQQQKEAKRKKQLEEAQISNNQKLSDILKAMNKKEFLIKENLHKKQVEKIKEAESKRVLVNRKLRKTQEYNENLLTTVRENFYKKQQYLEEVKQEFEIQKILKLGKIQLKNKQKEENIQNFLVTFPN